MKAAGTTSKKKPTARPKRVRALPAYRPEITRAICRRLADGESLRAICADPKMPAASTVFEWLRDERKADFLAAYETAREAQADAIFDQILDIADDATNDFMERKGDEAGDAYGLNGEHIQRSKIRIDARKWVLARMSPKKYGDKVDLNHGGGVTVEIVRLGE